MQIGFIIEFWRLNNVYFVSVNTASELWSVFVTGRAAPLIVSGQIWAQQSCHIPPHCNTPATTINLRLQIFIGFSFSLLSPFPETALHPLSV